LFRTTKGGEVEHVDLLELAGGSVFRGHHVQRQVDEIDDLGVALADARRLDDDEPNRCERRYAAPHRASRSSRRSAAASRRSA
jgi:hypothetical protein